MISIAAHKDLQIQHLNVGFHVLFMVISQQTDCAGVVDSPRPHLFNNPPLPGELLHQYNFIWHMGVTNLSKVAVQ